MVRFFYFLAFTLLFNSVFGQQTQAIDSLQSKSVLAVQNIRKSELIMSTISTGIVGGHRLLLNKKASTAIIYCITLGGGLGFLPLVDLITIIFTKRENLHLLQHKKFFLFNHQNFIQP